jgi:hypothetical protein
MFDTQFLAWGLFFVAVIALIAFPGRSRRRNANPGAEGLSDLYDDVPVGYLDIDMTGIVRRVNRKECELRSLAAEAMVGKHLADLNPSNPQ